MKIKTFFLCITFALGALVINRRPYTGLEPNLHSTSEGPLCTSFGLEKDGYVIHGFNLEHQTIHMGQVFINPRGMQKRGRDEGTSGRVAEWTSAYGSVTFNLVGYQYAEAGINEAGLTISTMSLKGSQVPSPDKRPPLDESLWTQYMLDNFSTVEGVISSFEEVRLNETNSHFFVCDRTGSCAAIEALDGQMVAYLDGDLPLKVMTNTAYQEALRALKRGALADGSLRRFGIVSRRLKEFDPRQDLDAIDFAFRTLAMATEDQVDTPPAQWSMVFDPYNFILYYRTLKNLQVRVLDFSRLDFSCLGPSLMLDIHEGQAGDVHAEFTAYDHQAVITHFIQFFHAWDIDISQEQSESLVSRLEGFSCSPTVIEVPTPPMPSVVTTSNLDQDGPQIVPWWVWLLVLGIPITAAIARVVIKIR